MTITDRAQRRLRVLFSVVVVFAVLATFSEVRQGIGWAFSVVCGTSHRTGVVFRATRREVPVPPVSAVLPGRTGL